MPRSAFAAFSIVLFGLSIVGRAAYADNGSNTLTPAEIKALVDWRGGPGSGDTQSLDKCCGIYIEKGTAKVTPKMIEFRDAEIKRLVADHDGAYSSLLSGCKISPPLTADVSVAMDTQTNHLPIDGIVEGFVKACTNKQNSSSARITKFVQSIKSIHLKLQTNTKSPDFIYKMDKKTGSLTVWVDSLGAQNIGDKTYAWADGEAH